MVELAKSRGGYDNITLAIIPLGGQLRQEPPIGFNGVQPPPREKLREFIASVSPRDIARDVVLIAMLTLVSCILTAMLAVYWWSR
jgi:hypothetical protein